MDIRNTHTYARLTFPDGSFELIEVGGVGLTLNEVGKSIARSSKRFNGSILIELSRKPFPAAKVDDDIRFANTYGLDPSTFIQEADLTDSMKETLALAREVESDTMLQEYRSMSVPSIREAMLPGRAEELRRYVESKYANTPHWDGSHRW